jgi:hypothetical protein
MKYSYAVRMGSGTVINIQSFMTTGSGVQKFIGRADSQTHRQHEDRISMRSFFLNKESRFMRSPFCPSVNPHPPLPPH